MTEADAEATGQVRVTPIQRWGRAAFPIPDALMAVLLAVAAAMEFLTPEQLATFPPAYFLARSEMVFGLIVEGGFLMMQGTLVDIATRLKKRPPVLVIVLIVGGVLLISGEAHGVLRAAWAGGLVVFVPLLISLAERATVLWHLPTKTRVQKIAARALVSNRIATALVLFGLVTAAMVAGTMLIEHYDFWNGAFVPLGAGAIYFAIAAFDDWRVRGRKFAENPTVLFRFDPLGATYLDPL